jgi:NADH/NAD ratio-sensing transcriptional regulator Rex
VDANIRGIMNFAPTQIKVPPNVVLRNVFFTSALDNLVYYLSR